MHYFLFRLVYSTEHWTSPDRAKSAVYNCLVTVILIYPGRLTRSSSTVGCTICCCFLFLTTSRNISDSGVGTMGSGDTLYPQVQDLYPLYLPSQRCGLCQNFKQTTLAARFYKVRTNLYPPLTKTFRRAWYLTYLRNIFRVCRPVLLYIINV